MKKGFTTFLSALKANTPPCKKGLSSRKFLSLFLILFLAVGNVWGQETETVDLAIAKNSNPSPSIGEIIGTNYNKGSFDGSGYKIGSDNNSIGWNIASSGKTFTSVSFEGYINTTNTAKNWGFKFSTDGGTTWGDELTQANDGTKSYHSINVTVAIPEGANAIQIIRKAGTSTYVRSITLTLAPDADGDPVPVTGISISPSPASVKVGKTITLTPAITPSNATDKAVTWAVTSGSSYASVTDAGVVSGLAVGTAVITATTHDGSGVTQTVTVNVEECPTSGTVFSMNITAPSGTAYTGNNTFPALIGATYVGGQAYSGSKSGTNRTSTINDSGEYPFSANSELAIKIVMDCPLEEGDIIDITTSSSRQIKIQKVVGTDLYKTVSKTFTIPEESALIGENVFYLMRDNSESTLSSLTVTRPVNRTITLEYADGVTADGSISAVDGAPATKPTDPTWEHHRFDGWYNGENPYDWTANVTGDLTLTAHWTQLYTITYAAGDGTATGEAPTQVDKAEGETFTVAANTFEVAGKDFVKWNDGTNDYAPGATYTVGIDNVVLTAQWKAAADKYTVIFKDGTTELGTKLFDVTTNPSDADIDKTKALNTFAAWQKEGVDIALDDAFWATVEKDAEITLTARWAAAYALNVNFKEAATQALGVETALNTYHYASDASDISFEEKGLKIKTNAARFYFNVAPGKVAEIKFGNISGATYSVDGGAAETLMSSQLKATYSASAQSCVMTMTTASYNIVEKVTIHDPFSVTFDANGGDAIEPMQGKPSITLPEPTNGIMNFKGWYDAATEGNKIGDAGEEYTPTADVTIYAQWEAVSTDARLASITFSSDAGTLSPAFDPEVTNYTYTMPYGTAAVPTITGATSVSAKAQEPQIISQASEWGETAVIRGVAESSDTKAYNITMLRAPKDGVCLVWADVPADNTLTYNATNSKFYAESDVTLQNSNVKGKDGSAPSGKKFQSNGFLKIALNKGTFLEGDVVALNVTYGTANVMHVFKAQAATSTDVIGEAAGNTEVGLNKVAITEDAATLWLVRGGNYDDWNPHVDYVAVYRAMNPVLTAITFDGVAGEIDEANKKVTVEVPFSSNVASMVVEPTIAWNAPAATNAIVVNDGSDWGVGDNTYVLTDKDGDQTTYTITLTQAAASADATLATLAYNGTNITLVPDQYTYDIELPKGTTVVPTVTYTTNHTGATVVQTDAAVLPGATTIIVTAEDGTTQQNYTINFTVSTSDIITIFDGSTMSNIATSPSGAISWEIVGSTMGAGDKNISYNDVTYTRALSCGNSSATKHLKIVVADNNKAQFEIIGMSNSNSDTRHAWLTNSTDKGEFANAIAGLTSNGYNPAKFTTDWLEEGTYYLHSDNTVAILLIRVKAEPVPAKCEAPTISGLADVAVCDLSSALLDGTATVSDGGTVTYKWYAEGDAETVLATTAIYAPTTVGNYYVVATNSLADHRDNSTTSSVVVVRIKTAPVITTEVLDQHAEAGNNVTLSVVATDAESYQWYTCDDAAGTNPVEVVGATNASLEVAVTSGMSQYYKVIISNTCGSAETVALVEEWHEIAPANVTGSRTWDWAAESMGEIATESGSVEYLMANVSSAVPNNENFRSDMLYITANFANRGASNKFFQGWQIRFYTEVPGKVSLNCRAIHGTMSITINGTIIDDAKGSDIGTATTPFFVPAGWVTIVFDNQSSGYEGEAARVQKIVFNANPDYTRSGLTVGSLGTICLPSNVPAGHAFGATFYKLEGKEPQYGKIVFDEIISGELEAGVPYLFQAQSDVLYCFYGTESVTEPDNSGAMKGTFVDMTLTNLTNIYYFAQKALWSCVDLTSLSVPANRAYVKMDEMPDITESNPAPGVRRITLGVNGQQVATGVDQVQGEEVPTKMIINGQLFILRGEKMYDAQGKLVK